MIFSDFINFRFNHLILLLILVVNTTFAAKSSINHHKLYGNISKINRNVGINKVIVFVWDGLRPDVINLENTPNLYKLKVAGTYFADHHSSYPTVTMNNANSLATGNFSGNTGFYGNTIFRPDLSAINQDFTEPVDVKKNKILKSLDNTANSKPLMYVDTLLQIARKKGFKTAQIGKPGAVELQDANKPDGENIILTENVVYPVALAKHLYKKGYNLPNKMLNNYNDPEFNRIYKIVQTNKSLVEENTINELTTFDGFIPLSGLSDPSTLDPYLNFKENDYLMEVFTREILEEYKPDLSIIWLKEPDHTAHKYGSGSKPYYQALKNQDEQLGRLLNRLNDLGLQRNTNLLVLSDHGHSNVSGDIEIYPLRNIHNGMIGTIDNNGFSVSGNIRVAELLSIGGFNAYDGHGCSYNPVLNGVYSDKTLVNPIHIDRTGDICDRGPNSFYTTKSYIVPKNIPKNSVIVAENSGTVYLYLPDKNQTTAERLVRFLQSRLEFDSIFVDNTSYGDLPGTMPLSTIKFNDMQQGRHPDIVVALTYNEHQVVNGLPGIIYTCGDLKRGAHGSLSPIDIHNVLIAYGPNFKTEYQDELPTSNIDVPITIANILNLSIQNRTGRPLLEALVGSGVSSNDYNLKFAKIQPSMPASELDIASLGKNKQKLPGISKYTYSLNIKQLYFQDKKYEYLDSGKAIRY